MTKGKGGCGLIDIRECINSERKENMLEYLVNSEQDLLQYTANSEEFTKKATYECL